MTATEPAWMEIHWPQPLDRAHVRGLLTRLAADQNRGPLVFEVRAEAGRIRYLLRSSGIPGVTLGRLLTQLVPGVIIAGPSAARADVDRVGRVRIRQRQLALGADQDGEILRAILAALAAARAEEDVLVLQVVLGTAAVPILVPRDALDPTASWTTALMVGNRQAGSEVRASMQTKLSQYRFRAAVRVGASSGSDARRKLLLFGILAALRGIQSPGTKLDLVPKRRDAIDIGYLPLRQTLRLSPDEAAIFLAWPAADTDLPGLPSPHPRQVPPPSRYTPPTERIFAASTAPGTNAPLGIAAADALRHTHIIGPTGVGKSTLMLHLIAADIAAGRSVVIIDPKRDLGMDVLSLIPEERRRDVVVLDPMLSQPVGLNPLNGDASAAPLVADNILAIFKGLFPSMFGPRTSDTLHGSLLTLASHPGATLTDLPALLTDASFRRRITARLDDPLGLEPFWAQYEAMSPGQQANAVGPVMTRLRQFLLRPQLRAVLGQAQPRFKLADVLTKKRIVIVTLNKGILGEQSAALLGSLIVSQLWQLILGRATLPKDQRPMVSIYLDEAQNVLHLDTDIGEALEQSRSFGAAWHLAHQFRAQMPPALLAGIDANTRSKIVFALDHADATVAAKTSGDLTPEDFEALPLFGIYASLLSGGQRTGWISGQTLPPPLAISDPDDLIAESQARYGGEPENPHPRASSFTGSGPGMGSAPDSEAIGRKRRTPPTTTQSPSEATSEASP